MSTNCYEIINPSDHATFLAPDREVALAVVALISQGYYAARCVAVDGVRVERDDALDVPMFWGDGSYEAWWRAAGYEEEPLARVLAQRRAEVSAALRSVAYCTIEERITYDAACAAITEADKLATFKAGHEDRNRSSLNAIVKRAWAWADRIEKNEAAA